MSTESQSNNKRIAKNTIFLYIRMIILLVVKLFTSRVILQALGVEDYGIYNVVGGIVVMFTFLNNAMAGATQRFLNFDLAKNNLDALKATFASSVFIHLIIAAIITILAESVGMWFFYEKMVIPADRMYAAMWVFQLSILAMFVSIINVPYNAAIIAHEKMDAFAYISIFEVIAKLLIVYMLYIIPYDKLIVYAILMFAVGVITTFIYMGYSISIFEETQVRPIVNVPKIKEMGSFAAWNLIGNAALIGMTQGLNMLLNVFFGPTVNAARGVAVQVQGAVQQFVQNFQMAVNPQITKTYAQSEFPQMHSLVCKSAKFSYYMMLLLSLPILLMTDQIIEIWLDTPPEYTSVFLRIIILNSMIDCFSNPLNTAVSSSGKIKVFQLSNGILMLMVLPISYFVLKMNANPVWVFLVQLFLTGITHFIKLIFAKNRTGISVRNYSREVYVPSLMVTVISPIIPMVIYSQLEHSIFVLLFVTIVCFLSVAFFSYTIGLKKSERDYVKTSIKNKLND